VDPRRRPDIQLTTYFNQARPPQGITHRLVAAYHTLFHRLTRFLFGHRAEPPSYALVEWLFIRILGLIYFMAFASLAVQITGLIGSHGILPAGDYLHAIYDRFGSQSYGLVPTVFWLNSGDAFLKAVCVAGAMLALVLVAGYAQRLILIVLFLLYLSLVVVGQDFLAFQWDALLLETGFLAIFLDDSRLAIWLFRWLLFRLVFLSGAVKLLSGDPTWRSLTALNSHYETQPLPTPLAWYMHQLPAGFQKLSVAAVFCIELGAPLLILAPRRLRFLAAAAIVCLQTLIGLTGNYAFFNLLTVALCVFLLDDAALRRWFPDRLAQALLTRQANRKASPARRWIAAGVAVLIVLVGSFQIVRAFGGMVPRPVRVVMNWVAPFQIVNPYGLFAVMTTSRPEIIIEGSNDGRAWLAYEFKYKPGDVRRPPSWVAPYQPRLDWQMWFAALGTCYDNPWFVNFTLRLRQGSPEVLALLGKNPFPDAPPLYIRALVYDYHFTDLATRRAEGTWWRREPMGAYACRFS
jgi:hypothetical protein